VTPEELNALGTQMLDAAFRVHTSLGPGLLESAYVACLVYKLRSRGFDVKIEVPVIYEGVKLADVGYRIDLLVENELIVEVKALEGIAPVHLAQLVSYLKLAQRRLGYLLNFNVEHLRDEVYRRVNRL